MTGPARLAIGAAGAALVSASVGGPVVLAVTSVALAGVAIARARGAAGAGQSAAVLVGALLVCLRIALAGPPPPSATLPAGSGPWTAVVESVGSPRAGARPAVVSLVDPPGVRLAATLPWYPEVEPGDRIRLDGTPEAPSSGDDFATYLRRIGAVGTIRARTLALLPNDSSGGPTWEALRADAAQGLQLAMPEPEAGLAAGILVGLRDRVDRDLAAAFTIAGVSHIVAISGWNIAIVATTLGALTGRLGRRRRTIATGLAIAAYVAFVGPSPSVVRAGAMAGCALLARELGRPTSAISAMGLAVSGLLLLDPANVEDPGFQLSVLATAGLITWGTGLAHRLAGPNPGRGRSWLAESLGVSLAAQAATLPVILLDFGRLSIVSPAVNLLVAPIVAPAMAAGGVALVAGLLVVAGAPAGLATLLGLPAWGLLAVLVAIVRIGAGLPFASVSLDPPANIVAAVVAAGVVLLASRGMSRLGAFRIRFAHDQRHAPLVAGRRARAAGEARASRPRASVDRQRRWVAVALGVATLAVGLAAAHRPDGTTRITVLDVGQGDAILVEGGSGSRLLVDGGPDPGRLLLALDEHLPPWDRRIDAVVLTHPHEDHVAGLAQLLTRYRISRVFEPGMIGPGPGYAAWQAVLARGGPTRWALGTGDRLAVDDVSLRVLWPDPGRVPLHPADGGTAINNVSIVLEGEVAGHRFLLMGDVEQAIDPQLLARGLPKIDFLKVAHHGSGTSSTEAFLAAVRPQVAAVSVGAGNPYGHPAAATIARLRRVASTVLRTDLDGSVTLTFDGPGVRVRASGPRKLAAAPATQGQVPWPPGLASIFLCGVPTTAWRQDPSAASAAITAPAAAAADPTPLVLRHPAALAGRWSSPRYHRSDDNPLARGGGAPAPVARSSRLARATLAHRRRDRGLAGASGRRRGPEPGRGGRAPP